MNPNPPAGGPPGPSGTTAKDALNIPSILLMVGGALGALNSVYSLISGGANPAAAQFANNPQVAQAMATAQKAGPVGAILGILTSAFVIFGALKMRSAQSFGLAMAAAIVAMLPCSCTCCIGIPVGIWALVVMNKPEVKSSFT